MNIHSNTGTPGIQAMLIGGLVAFFCSFTAHAELDVAKFCEDWDRSLTRGLYSGPGEMLPRLVEYDSADGVRRVRLGNRDQAIVDRVVELFIAEYQYGNRALIKACEEELSRGGATPERDSFLKSIYVQTQARLESSVAREGDLVHGVPSEELTRSRGEGEADYRDALCALALSTMSPRIYEYVWDPSVQTDQNALVEYLGTVNFERTIELLGSARLGENPWIPTASNFDTLYRADQAGELSVIPAVSVLYKIATTNPEFATAHRNTMLQLVQKCRDVYWIANDSEFNTRYVTHNYRLRSAMLDVLSVVGTQQEAPLAESLAMESLPASELAKKGPLWAANRVVSLEETAHKVVSALKAAPHEPAP